MFVECIVYLKDISMDYFNVIQNKITKIDMDVLKVRRIFPLLFFNCPKSISTRIIMLQKIKTQLNPFGPVFRPIVARFISNLEQTETIENQVNFENNFELHVCAQNFTVAGICDILSWIYRNIFKSFDENLHSTIFDWQYQPSFKLNKRSTWIECSKKS